MEQAIAQLNGGAVDPALSSSIAAENGAGEPRRAARPVRALEDSSDDDDDPSGQGRSRQRADSQGVVQQIIVQAPKQPRVKKANTQGASCCVNACVCVCVLL
jgi:hypothetical protein